MLMDLIRAIAARDEKAFRLVENDPGLARKAVEMGATPNASSDLYFKSIEHYVYGGDTALHVAAAAHDRAMSLKLLSNGANVQAKNRRGVQPLHYAVDASPDTAAWNPVAQVSVVQCLIEAGADPNGVDKSGVGPLHRAVRTRSAAAVRALLLSGADVRLWNGNGSTPLHLAVQNTGRGGSGSSAARAQQSEIILSLLQHGARPTDKDMAGKSVLKSAASEWIIELLEEAT
jgi:ankyrin repeat protein